MYLMIEKIKGSVIMDKYVILTDSCIDLPYSLAKELELTIIPLKVTIKGKEYRNLLDESELSSRVFIICCAKKK